MSHLKSFAGFVKENKLADLVSSILQNWQSAIIPIPVFLKHLPENELYGTTQTLLLQFLNGLEKGNLDFYGHELIASLPDSRINLHPITLAELVPLYLAQKTGVVLLIPLYTGDSLIAAEIFVELEFYYQHLAEKVFNILQHTQNDEQEKRMESEERYRDLFDNASDLIHIATPEGEIIYVNNAWLNAIGYTQEELRGQSLYSFIAEKERTRFREYRTRVLSGEMHLKDIETYFLSKNGNEIIVEGSISCKFKDGKPEYTRGILRNITNRKGNEKKLQFYTEQLVEREENIRQLIHNAPDAVIVIDEKSNILLWNPKAENIFGWSADEVIGEPLSDTIIPVQYRDAHINGMRRLLSTGEERVLNKTIEISALNKIGNEFYISLTISRSKRSGDSTFIAFIRDISEQKKNELELEKKRNQLEKTNLELEQFAWVASHDLKEPLRKILTFSDMLMSRYELSSPVMQTLVKINNSAMRMNELIKGILLYSNVSDERQLFELTNLNTIVEHVLTDLELGIAEKKAQINIHALPSVEAVPFQMSQLFQNLIDNSLKYSKPGIPPIIDISSQPLDEKRTRITIKDNGIGFEPAYNEKIFQVFKRLSTHQTQEGTGIGLALCKKISETHGGKITAEGYEGIGTVISIILPYHHD